MIPGIGKMMIPKASGIAPIILNDLTFLYHDTSRNLGDLYAIFVAKEGYDYIVCEQKAIYHYQMSTPHDPTSRTLANSISWGYDSIGSIWFSSDGLTAMVGRSYWGSGNYIMKWNLTVPYDVSQLGEWSYSQMKSVLNRKPNFNDDGTEVYFSDGSTFKQYSISSFDLTTLSLTGSFTHSKSILKTSVSEDGCRILGLRGGVGSLYLYDLTTPYDITTASYNSERSWGTYPADIHLRESSRCLYTAISNTYNHSLYTW